MTTVAIWLAAIAAPSKHRGELPVTVKRLTSTSVKEIELKRVGWAVCRGFHYHLGFSPQ